METKQLKEKIKPNESIQTDDFVAIGEKMETNTIKITGGDGEIDIYKLLDRYETAVREHERLSGADETEESQLKKSFKEMFIISCRQNIVSEWAIAQKFRQLMRLITPEKEGE